MFKIIFQTCLLTLTFRLNFVLLSIIFRTKPDVAPKKGL